MLTRATGRHAKQIVKLAGNVECILRYVAALPLLDETAVTGDFDGESIEAVVLDMIHRSCVIMPDRASADRLVETVLLRAIAEAKGGQFEGDVRPRLMDMLEEEYRLNSRCFLN